MIKISDITEELLREDAVALRALHRGVLNHSAYAEEILPEVELRTMKPVTKNSIAMAISRLADTIREESYILPQIALTDVSIKAPLIDVTYPKTEQVISALADVRSALARRDSSFSMITQGTREVTVIVDEHSLGLLQELMPEEPTALYRNLVAVSVSFSESYLDEPNLIYGLLESAVVHQINLVEVVSTYTELTAVVQRQDMDEMLQAWQRFLR